MIHSIITTKNVKEKQKRGLVKANPMGQSLPLKNIYKKIKRMKTYKIKWANPTATKRRSPRVDSTTLSRRPPWLESFS